MRNPTPAPPPQPPDECLGVAFDPRLVDATVAEANANAPVGITGIHRQVAIAALYEAATGFTQGLIPWIAESGRIVWANRSTFLTDTGDKS